MRIILGGIIAVIVLLSVRPFCMFVVWIADKLGTIGAR